MRKYCIAKSNLIEGYPYYGTYSLCFEENGKYYFCRYDGKTIQFDHNQYIIDYNFEIGHLDHIGQSAYKQIMIEQEINKILEEKC